jgi:hypothetical protein
MDMADQIQASCRRVSQRRNDVRNAKSQMMESAAVPLDASIDRRIATTELHQFDQALASSEELDVEARERFESQVLQFQRLGPRLV